MDSNLVLQLSSVTERSALAAYQWLGRGDKNRADQAAVESMRQSLNQIEMSAEIVIGEGEIDDAPMLFIGEKLGLGGPEVDIAVDPIDGTRMTAMGQSGAVAVLAAAEHGGLLKAPDMYMEKLAVGPAGKGLIDLNQSVEDNLAKLAKAEGKSLSQMTLVTLAKPRHQDLIQRLHSRGVRVHALPDGDVAASLLTCMPNSGVDLMYCIGGAPEGVISAAGLRAMGGDMQARLVPRTEAKGKSEESRREEELERRRCKEMEVEIDTCLAMESLASSSNVAICMTGITSGELLAGISIAGKEAATETLVVNGISGVRHLIRSQHPLD